MTVYLVGAGPGDPDLLTIKAAKLLQRADVVIYDRLIEPAVLELAPPWAEMIDAGKRPGAPANAQTRINDVLIDRGRRFECVVRLKGGDPFVFGRGGEEALELRAAGIDVEEVPGITSAIAAPAAAGIPVTMRGLSSGFTVITGHQDPNTERWARLGRAGSYRHDLGDPYGSITHRLDRAAANGRRVEWGHTCGRRLLRHNRPRKCDQNDPR